MEDVDAGVVRRALQVGVLDDGAVDVPGELLLGDRHRQPVAALALGGRGVHLLFAQDLGPNSTESVGSNFGSSFGSEFLFSVGLIFPT